MIEGIKKNISSVADAILIILLFILSIQKGGFYKGDIILFSLIVDIIGLITIIYNAIKNYKKEKFDIIGMLLLLLPVAYALPIVFTNYSSLSDSIIEMVRYFNIYMIYKIVRNSKNKKIYENVVIYISIFLGLLGIDGLGQRFLQGILQYFNSNYLNMDLTRMSSTIQYANVLAIMFAISSILLFEKLKNNILNKDKKKAIINYILLFFTLSCLVLTLSRAVMIITLSYYIARVIFDRKYRKNNIVICILLLFEIAIFSIFTFNLMYVNKLLIYIITIIFTIFSIFIGFVILKLVNIDDKVISFLSKYKRIVIFITIVIVSIYMILALNISAPLNISENATDSVRRSIYLEEGRDSNNIKFNIRSVDEDSRYRVKIYGVSYKNEKKVLKAFEYYNTVSGNFNFDFKVEDNIKNIELEFDCYKGKVIVDNIKLNDNKVILNYALLPSDIIFKIKDIVYGADSFNTRVIYFSDALKIWNISLNNKVIGVGGEGFKNLYETVQSERYTSTEVHNSFIQILVESGILGFTCILAVCIIYILKSKNNTYKFAFILLMLHSCFDLNFSYTIILCIFAILLGINEIEYKKIESLKGLAVIENIFLVVFSLFTMGLLFKINYAYYLKIPVYSQKELTLERHANVVSLLEKRVMLDGAENKYRKELAKEYNNYLSMLIEWINKDPKNNVLIEESKNVIQNIKVNADNMYENEKYNKNNLIDVSNIYFNNLVYLTKEEFTNEEDGYIFYLNKIRDNLEYIKNNYKYSDQAKKLLKETYNSYYNELSNKNIVSKTVKEFIDYLEKNKN